MISYEQLRHFCFDVLSKSSPYRINVCELMARSYVKSCKHFHVSRCAQMCFNKKYNQIEIILYSYIMQYRSFDLSNIRRIMGISTNDYTNLIATVQGTSSYIAYWGPRYVEFFPFSTINLHPSKWSKTPFPIKTLQSGRHIFRCRHTGTITINVGMLESIHKLRKFNKWTLIVYLNL